MLQASGHPLLAMYKYKLRANLYYPIFKSISCLNSGEIFESICIFNLFNMGRKYVRGIWFSSCKIEQFFKQLCNCLFSLMQSILSLPTSFFNTQHPNRDLSCSCMIYRDDAEAKKGESIPPAFHFGSSWSNNALFKYNGLLSQNLYHATEIGYAINMKYLTGKNNYLYRRNIAPDICKEVL